MRFVCEAKSVSTERTAQRVEPLGSGSKNVCARVGWGKHIQKESEGISARVLGLRVSADPNKEGKQGSESDTERIEMKTRRGAVRGSDSEGLKKRTTNAN